MDKYGVEFEHQKIATPVDGCPWCGASLAEGPRCPKHGTEPFERYDEAPGEEKDNEEAEAVDDLYG